MRWPWPFRRRERLTLGLPEAPPMNTLAHRDPLDPERADHVPMTAASASAWTQPSRAAKRREELGLPIPSDPPPPTLHSILLQCDEALGERDARIKALEADTAQLNKLFEAAKAAEQAACKLVAIAHEEREGYIRELFEVDATLARLAAEFGMKLYDFDHHRKTLIDHVIKHKIVKLKRAHIRALKRVKTLTGK